MVALITVVLALFAMLSSGIMAFVITLAMAYITAKYLESNISGFADANSNFRKKAAGFVGGQG